jgi:uncharacterized membrane protein
MNKKELSMATIFTAFVTVSTMSFTLYIPATRGYFNLGEVFVYISAILGGPMVGMIAGGLGSAFADVALGYAPYAPGTLIIKGLEGFVVGYIVRKYYKRASTTLWRITGIALSIAISSLLAFVGISLFSGEAEAYISVPGTTFSIPLQFTIYHTVWGFVSLILLAFLVYWVVKADPSVTTSLLGVTLGGSIMVSGYFLYEAYALRLGILVAGVEVPFNITQFLVGTAISLPIVQMVRRMVGVKEE